MTDSISKTWHIRPAQPGDSPHIAALETAHPDSGALGLSFHYKVDALAAQQALRPGSVCLVADAGGSIVGMGFYWPSIGTVSGSNRFVGMIYGLVVHSEFRRQGIASSIYAALVEHIRTAGGPGAVVVAGVQAGNEGSVKAAKRWATQSIIGRTRVLVRPTRSKAPKLPRGLEFREVSDADWVAVAEGITTCYQDHELAPKWDAAQMRDSYEAVPFGERIRGYVVATNEHGEIIAGIGAVFDGLVETGHFERMPLVLRMVDAVFHLLPRDGVLRRVVCRDVWFSRDVARSAEALSALWDFASWTWRAQGNNLMLITDRNGPVSRAIPKKVPIPDVGSRLMVASEPEIDLARPLWLPL
jgi:predicted N-acetyltransferase YhbS